MNEHIEKQALIEHGVSHLRRARRTRRSAAEGAAALRPQQRVTAALLEKGVRCTAVGARQGFTAVGGLQDCWQGLTLTTLALTMHVHWDARLLVFAA